MGHFPALQTLLFYHLRSCLDCRIRRSETQDGLLSAGLVVILTHKNHHASLMGILPTGTSLPHLHQHRRRPHRDQRHRLCGVRAGQGQGAARPVPHRGIDLAAVRLPRRDAGGPFDRLRTGRRAFRHKTRGAAVQFQPVHHRSAADARAGRADRVVV